MAQKIESDHYPEIVENGQGTRRLELLGINEQLRDPHDRREFFGSPTDEQFTKMVGYVNSITQGQKISYDYEDGTSSSHTPPLEDKARLMELAFKSIREITADPELDDKTALRLAGLTMAGAMNYIHPREGGNGRTGRVLHYLIEFGTERGDKAFNEEMYAIMGKLPVYDTDAAVALFDTPPDYLERALDEQIQVADPGHFSNMSDRERASGRVVAFLDMMQGKSTVHFTETVHIPLSHTIGQLRHSMAIRPGQIDGLSLYERTYLAQSMIPNRLPGDVPEEAHRVMAEKSSAPEFLHVSADIV